MPSLPPVWIPILMAVVFLASFARASRRPKADFSPRNQQRKQRVIFYCFIPLALLTIAIRVQIGSFPWWSCAFWLVMLVSLGWNAFRPLSQKDLDKTFALEPGRCSRCGYDLTGNVSGLCPECGWTIPPAPPRVEDPLWALWWKGWKIDYLEDSTKSLRAMAGLSAMFGATAAAVLLVPMWVLPHSRGPELFALIPGFMCIHFAINAVRVYAYGSQPNGDAPPPDPKP